MLPGLQMTRCSCRNAREPISPSRSRSSTGDTFFSSNLPTLITAQDISRYTELASPRTNSELPRGELADVEQLAWGASRNDFFYISYPSVSHLTANSPWAYENPNRVNDGINILFGD